MTIATRPTDADRAALQSTDPEVWSLIARDRRYEANVRAKIDFGTVPFTMRVLMFWVSDWHRESDWYAWTFQP